MQISTSITPLNQLQSLENRLSSGQIISQDQAWEIQPLMDSADQRISHLACKILSAYHKDLPIQFLGGETSRFSSALLYSKSTIFPKDMRESVKEHAKMTVPLRVTERALKALESFWSGVPLSTLIAEDSGDGSLVAEFYQAADYLGNEELLAPQLWVQSVAETCPSSFSLYFQGEQIVLKGPLSTQQDLNEWRRLLNLTASVGLYPICNLSKQNAADFWNPLQTLLNDKDNPAVPRGFDLTVCGISRDQAVTLLALLEDHPCLQSLDLCCNLIGVEGAKALATLLAKCTTLQHLGLAYSVIDEESIKALANALEKSPSLQELNLRLNHIGVEGAVALGAALEKNSHLKRLVLTYNPIGDEGAKALAKALEKNSSLQQLSLRKNSIKLEGAKALAKALEKNSSLQELDLAVNSIGGEGAKALAISLENNRSLRKICLQQNDIEVEDTKRIKIIGQTRPWIKVYT